MLRLFCMALVTVLAIGSVISCDSDEPILADPPVIEPPFDLTQKDRVLVGLELLFNEFNSTEYQRLLDDDFVFFFSDADYSSGRTPEKWDQATELVSYNNFFDPARSTNRVLSRSLALTYAVDNWTEITPDDPVTFPGESWYVATILYNMSVVLDTEPELTLVANGLKEEITIRWSEDHGHWRIIRWRDDVD